MSDKSTNPPRWVGGVEPPQGLLSATGTQILELECREQPRRLRELLQAYRGEPAIGAQFEKLRQLARKPGPVLFLGMGASLCSSFSGSVLLQTHGRLAFSVDAGEWLHYGRPLWDDPSLAVLLTTSGESAELVELLRAGGDRASALICNNTASICWQLGQHRFPILAGPEYGNATKTYTNAAAAAIALASELLGLSWQDDADRAADLYASALDPVFALRQDLEAICRGAANIEIIGRGAAYGAAVMSALCIREMSGVRAAAHTGAGFRHGPNLDVDGTHAAIVFALGRAASLGVKLADECLRRGGRVVLVSAEERPPTERLFPVRLPAVPEPWESLTSVLVAQALTLAMVERTGCRLPPRFQYGLMEQ